jgi:hypothetical protein
MGRATSECSARLGAVMIRPQEQRCGIMRPNVLPVLSLMINSNLVGCSSAMAASPARHDDSPYWALEFAIHRPQERGGRRVRLTQFSICRLKTDVQLNRVTNGRVPLKSIRR